MHRFTDISVRGPAPAASSAPLSDEESRALDEAASNYAAQWSQDAPNGGLIEIGFALIARATNGLDEEKHLIGHGGSCRVFNADINDVKTAIKVMNDRGRLSKDARLAAFEDRQVKAEIELLCGTLHPHINRLLGISFDGPYRCLVLERMNGGALDDRLRNRGLPALQWCERARIILHTARGLAYMHSLNPPVIHRDVKCGNVLLHYPDGDATQTLTAKVSDFGIARVNAEQDESVLRTSERTHASTMRICGTGPYMSPEYEKRGQVSARTDSFALGIMIIELLLSVDPYVAREIADDSTHDELPTEMQQIHDGEAEIPTASAALARDMPPVLRCEWPAADLQAFGAIAARCLRTQNKLRATVVDVLPELEQLVAAAEMRTSELPQVSEARVRRLERGEGAGAVDEGEDADADADMEAMPQTTIRISNKGHSDGTGAADPLLPSSGSLNRKTENGSGASGRSGLSGWRRVLLLAVLPVVGIAIAIAAGNGAFGHQHAPTPAPPPTPPPHSPTPSPPGPSPATKCKHGGTWDPKSKKCTDCAGAWSGDSCDKWGMGVSSDEQVKMIQVIADESQKLLDSQKILNPLCKQDRECAGWGANAITGAPAHFNIVHLSFTDANKIFGGMREPVEAQANPVLGPQFAVGTQTFPGIADFTEYVKADYTAHSPPQGTNGIYSSSFTDVLQSYFGRCTTRAGKITCDSLSVSSARRPIVQLTLPYDSVTNKYTFTLDKFAERAIQSLPPPSVYANISPWWGLYAPVFRTFFDKWGTDVILSASMGGLVELYSSFDASRCPSLSKDQLINDAEIDLMKITSIGGHTGKKDPSYVADLSPMTCIGGDPSKCNKDGIEGGSWGDSTTSSPALLEYTVVPISELLGGLSGFDPSVKESLEAAAEQYVSEGQQQWEDDYKKYLACQPPFGLSNDPHCAPSVVCKASDPALNLTKDDGYNPPVYYAADNGQLQRMCECTTIDYAYIGEDEVLQGCPTCAQATLDACRLESISGKDPYGGKSISITGPAPHITSLRGLARLSGALPGALAVAYMDELTTLEGLGNITRIGQDSGGRSITLRYNPKLASATALNDSKATFTSDALWILDNPQLACVPEQWPSEDKDGRIIRNGKALHDPCQYQCDSTTGTCSRTADGDQSESACEKLCVPKSQVVM